MLRATALTLALGAGCSRTPAATTPTVAGAGAGAGSTTTGGEATAAPAPSGPACEAWLAALAAAELDPLPPCEQQVDLDGDGQLDRLFVVSSAAAASGDGDGDDGDDGDGDDDDDDGESTLVVDLMVELAGARPVRLGSAAAPLWDGEVGEPGRRPRQPDPSDMSWLQAWRPAQREGLYLQVGGQRFAVPGRGGAVWVSGGDAAALLLREGERWVLLGLGY